MFIDKVGSAVKALGWVLLIFVLVNCGGRNNQPLKPTPQDTPTVSFADNSACNSLSASAQYTPQPLYLINGQAIANVSVTVAGCSRYKLAVPKYDLEFNFTGDKQVFPITLTNVGTHYLELSIVSLNDKSELNSVEKVITLSISILASPIPSPSPSDSPSPSPSASPTPSPTPSPSPSPISCLIDVVGSIAATDSPFPLYISGTGPITAAYLNGQFLPSFPRFVSLNPVLPGSGLYIANVEVRDELGRSAICSRTHTAPTVELAVLSTSPTSVQFEMTLHGPVSVAKLDGTPLPLPVVGNKIQYTKTPSGPGTFTALGEVLNVGAGDRGNIEKSYCVPRNPIQGIRDTEQIFRAGPVQIPAQELNVAAGIRPVTSFDIALIKREMNLQIKGSATRVAGTVCNSNEVMTGIHTWGSRVYCTELSTPLGGTIRMENVNTKSFVWTGYPGPKAVCNSNEVMIGYSIAGGGSSYTHTITCALPVLDDGCP